MASDRILTPEQIEKVRARADEGFGWVPEFVSVTLASHEALRAERDEARAEVERLREADLILRWLESGLPPWSCSWCHGSGLQGPKGGACISCGGIGIKDPPGRALALEGKVLGRVAELEAEVEFVLRSNESVAPRVWITVERRDRLVAIAEAAQEWKDAADALEFLSDSPDGSAWDAGIERYEASEGRMRSLLEQK